MEYVFVPLSEFVADCNSTVAARTYTSSISADPRWARVRKAAETRDLRTVDDALQDMYGDYGLQEIEWNLRKHEIPVWLIARRRCADVPADAVDFQYGDRKNLPYMIHLSTRSWPGAEGDVLAESESYRENFDKLPDTGSGTIIDMASYKKSVERINATDGGDKIVSFPN